MINLQSLLQLPKPTQHFLTHLHRQYKSFQHLLTNPSPNLPPKINHIFPPNISQKQIHHLPALLYYPQQKLDLIKNHFNSKPHLNQSYILTIQPFIHLITYSSSKYTPSKLPKPL
ncbi:fructose-bisphosphatase class III, partial [Staphylococcus hominis]|uniref:fructose-bisphosphatase class III n=1 Tax=Staphylococcus hominis TaxID=1290 RepID=UPI0028D8BECE